jgi:hypothetical protein
MSEDFTTYTEVDGGGDLTVIANKITVASQARNVDNYVYDDKGVDHFGDFEHLISAKLTTTVDGSTGGVWALSNSIDDLLGLFSNDVIALYNNTASGANRFIFVQYTGGVLDGSDAYLTAAVGTQYWFTLSRSGTSLQCLIYDDVDRTSLVDTLSFTGGTTTQRYAYGATSYNSGSPILISYEVSDFDLQEAVAAAVRRIAGLMGLGKLGIRL